MSAPCPRTAEVEADPSGHTWPPNLRSHAASCPRCAQTALVVRRVRDLGAGVEVGGAPSAGLVFLRSRIRSRLDLERRDAERATWPLRLAEAALGLAVLAVPLLGSWWAPAAPMALLFGVVLAARR